MYNKLQKINISTHTMICNNYHAYMQKKDNPCDHFSQLLLSARETIVREVQVLCV